MAWAVALEEELAAAWHSAVSFWVCSDAWPFKGVTAICCATAVTHVSRLYTKRYPSFMRITDRWSPLNLR